MKERYRKNLDKNFPLSLQDSLLNKSIAVIGCGGNGGYILEFLARLGVKSLTFWDGDYYTESNLNRQFGCSEENISKNKALCIADELKRINSSITLNPHPSYFDNYQDFELVLKCDIVILACDDSQNILKVRNLIREAILAGIPCIDECLNGLGGEVSIITNQDMSVFDYNTSVWSNNSKIAKEQLLSSQPAYKCAMIAAEAVNQMVKYFNNSPFVAKNYKIIIDMYHSSIIKVDQYGQI